MIGYVHSIHMDCPAPTILTLSLPSNLDHGLLPLLLFLLLVQAPPPATAQSPNRPPPPERLPGLRFDKSMAIVLVILVVVFFILGFLSVYTRQCAELRLRGRLDLSIPIVGSDRRHRGLDLEIIHTFPTFVYSTVKGLKIGRATLECVVCLNEFQDDETLRLIPKCSHVFHPQCIDVWLSTHSTCPVCRANLVPGPGDMSSSFVGIQIPDPGGTGSNQPHSGSNSDSEPQHSTQVGHHNRNGAEGPESPKVTSVHQNHPLRSRSTGFRISSLFPRSHSTGHSLVQPGENCERFTLRLPEEMRNQLLNSTLSRTRSCGVTFTRESSGRTGYRTRSVGSTRGRSYLQYERFGREARPDRWGFSWTPPFVNRAGSTRSTKRSPESNISPVAVDDAVGERSSDRLFPAGE